jgi:hypothetical protein
MPHTFQYFDGASRGNPGFAGSAAVILDDLGNIVSQPSTLNRSSYIVGTWTSLQCIEAILNEKTSLVEVKAFCIASYACALI